MLKFRNKFVNDRYLLEKIKTSITVAFSKQKKFLVRCMIKYHFRLITKNLSPQKIRKKEKKNDRYLQFICPPARVESMVRSFFVMT